MSHELILVEWIHPNPFRNFTRNPIRQEQVAKIVESIGRTGFWDNIVVRPHPAKPGEFQIAYGHNRLEAIKQVDISEVFLPVRDLSDWDMYCMMVDENESQQEINPGIVLENVETGLGILEQAFKAIGPEGTMKAFQEQIGAKVVPVGTTFASGGQKSSFTQVRNTFFKEGVIGRSFVQTVLPCGNLRAESVSTVLNSHYGEKMEQARRKDAAAKRDDSEEKRKRAEAEWDQAEADRLRNEAEEDDLEARKLEAEARRIGSGTISAKILLAFDTPNQMTSFASAVKAAGVPKSQHKAAMEYVQENEIGSGKMASRIKEWWFEESGQAQKAYEAMRRAEAQAERARIAREGTYKPHLIQMEKKIADLNGDIELALQEARYYDDDRHRNAMRRKCQALRDNLDRLIEDFSGRPQPFPNGRPQLQLPSTN